MIKIGLIGSGCYVKSHIKILKDLPGFELVGFFNPDPQKAKETLVEFNIHPFKSPKELFNFTDAIDIPRSTNSYFNLTVNALKNSKHIFIESLKTNSLEEADHLIKLAKEANVTVQVGQTERFNPAFNAAKSFFNNPMFIEIIRQNKFNSCSFDDHIVLSSMIHDIEVVLSIIKSNIKKVSANGVSIVSNSSDIANARIEFDNGCVATLTTNRISMKDGLKCRIYQQGEVIFVDFKNKKTKIAKLKNIKNNTHPINNAKKEIYLEKPEIKSNNAIKDELASFQNAIRNNSTPLGNIEDGNKALYLAHKILEMINRTVPRF